MNDEKGLPVTDLFDIRGKVALVTGGANGMGRMIAEGFVRAAAKVYITSRKLEDAERTAHAFGTLGECHPIVADLSTPAAAVALAEMLATRESGLHVLVNNAGKTWGAPLEQFPDKAWPSVFAVNVQGPFTLVRELLPLLRHAATPDDPARVINIGSLAGAVVEPIEAYSYAASKAAMHHLSRVLAKDLAGSSITVNTVMPGYFPTQMTAHIRADEQRTDGLQQRIPLRRLGSPQDIAGMCIFLASRAGAYVTGAELPVDGGLSGCR
jgi:NAD(P)-dependent dehydrogenase (short-subunit alcohol dehydrogenase family)